MIALTFNLLLKNAGINPKEVYLVRHKDTRIAQSLLRSRGSSPYELWLTQRNKFETYQQLQGGDCFRKRDWIASFVATPWNETLFVGLYRKQGCGKLPVELRVCPVSGKPVSDDNCVYYDLVLNERLLEWSGKLTIEWGDGFRAWIQNADSKESGDKKIVEIRKEVQESPFPGYREFRHENIAEIQSVLPSWQVALRNCKGIYLLTCKDHGEPYVGKADGDCGFWGRFITYATTVHGGNEGMKQHKCSGYTVTILEAIATPTLDELDLLESLWKDKLGSRKWGLNEN